MWRGDYYPANKNETARIRQQLETEKFAQKWKFGEMEMVPYHKQLEAERPTKLKQRVSEYFRQAYKKIKARDY